MLTFRAKGSGMFGSRIGLRIMSAIVIYRDHAGEYHWHLLTSKNRRIAHSGEGYENESDCIEAINLVKTIASKAEVIDPCAAESEKDDSWKSLYAF